MIRPRFLLAALLAGAPPAIAQQGDREGEVQAPLPEHLEIPPAPPLSPEEALQSFSVAPGFRIELVASEPLLFDPITLTIGPDGRMWVVEMRGFMPNVDGDGEDAPIGSIAVLSDTDGDGRMDRRQEFAGGFVLPRALALVDGGVLVAEPPHLWWLRDTDGDGRADTRTEIASDYGAPGNPEHTANGLLQAVDNWVYNANHRTRFRYDGGGQWRRETTISRGQWGITQDDTGRLYYNNNSLPLQVDLLPASYLARNPDLTEPSTAGRIVAPLNAIRVWPGRVTPGVNRGYRILDEEGKIREVTAACAPLVYRSSRFPAEFRGNVFFAEPAGNLVKRLLIEPTPDGGLRGVNAYDGREFLTSTDERFRPVNFAEGPDGALYIVDMYRGVIQHRNFVTSFLRKQIEERRLDVPIGMGRIYRVVPDEPAAPASAPALQQAGVEELVAALDHPHAWWRDTAQRLLVERRQINAVGALRQLTQRGTPVGILHAIWTLEGLGGLQRETLEPLLAHDDPRVQAAAVRLLEPWLREGDAALTRRIAVLADRSSPDLRRQIALSLGEASDVVAFDALLQLASRQGSIVGMDDAIVSGLRDRELRFLEKLAQATTSGATHGGLPVAEQAVAALVRRGDPDQLLALWAMAAPGEASSTSALMRRAILGGLERLARVRGREANETGRRVTLAIDPDPVFAIAREAESDETRRAQRLLPLLFGPSKRAEAGAAPVRPLTPEEQRRFTAGEAGFAVCAGCHHPEGTGYTGVAPALVGSRWVTGPEEAVIRIVLHGKEGESFGMPPLAALDDETVAAILTYIRRSWGHGADPVKPEAVADVRAAEAGRDRPWSAGELERLVSHLRAQE
jgi:mono/diheme cytochrome c family protein/glucose/arabinose dehydrogenase